MKRNCLLLPRSFSFFAMVAILSCAFLCFSATTVAAQLDASVAPPPPISTEGYPQEPEWKSSVDYSAVVASERANAAQVLASPTIKELEFALYTGYDRMLAYMEADMASGIPIEEIAEKNFIKVSQEAPADPVLVNMEASEFNTLYVALLGMLHQ